MVGEDGKENVPHRDWLLTFDRVLNEVKADMKQQGRGDEFIGARVSFLKDILVNIQSTS
jgi:adenosine deaminase CECR1